MGKLFNPGAILKRKPKPGASAPKNSGRPRWTIADLKLRLNIDPAKLQITARPSRVIKAARLDYVKRLYMDDRQA